MSKTALTAARSDVYNIRYDNDVIIRMITDPAHPDYDPRVELPVDPELMESIRMVGQLEPASGYKAEIVDGCQVVHIVFGRQRWKAVSAIWGEMLAKGEDMELAPAFKLSLQRTEDAAKRRQKRIIENRHRQGLEGLALAREVANHLAVVGEDDQAMEQARILFNFKSLAALTNCLALLDTTEKVQAKIVDGTISPTAALQLSRQPAQIQDAVVDRIESGEAEDDDEPEAGEEAPQIDAFREEFPAPAAESLPKATKPVSVSGIKEMIREETGQTNYTMVTLKQVEKQIERKEAELEKALTKLEQCPTSVYDTGYQKTINQAGKVAEIQGEIKALRWTRGEAFVTGADESHGNDKMSAAWDVLRDALASAPWPTFLTRDDFEWPQIPNWGESEDPGDEKRNAVLAERAAILEKIDASHILVVAGEKVALRSCDSKGSTYNIVIDTDSKWFIRLMDPYGKPSQLVRDWGVHGRLETQGKTASVPTYKTSQSELSKSRTCVQIKRGEHLSKWIEGTPLQVAETTEASVLRIVKECVRRKASRECRFFSPYLEDGDGPHLQEDLSDRLSIQTCLEDDLGISVPDAECVWDTVGDLVDYVESKIASKPSAESEAADA